MPARQHLAADAKVGAARLKKTRPSDDLSSSQGRCAEALKPQHHRKGVSIMQARNALIAGAIAALLGSMGMAYAVENGTGGNPSTTLAPTHTVPVTAPHKLSVKTENSLRGGGKPIRGETEDETTGRAISGGGNPPAAPTWTVPVKPSQNVTIRCTSTSPIRCGYHEDNPSKPPIEERKVPAPNKCGPTKPGDSTTSTC
jgi:hypothetical protein